MKPLDILLYTDNDKRYRTIRYDMVYLFDIGSKSNDPRR